MHERLKGTAALAMVLLGASLYAGVAGASPAMAASGGGGGCTSSSSGGSAGGGGSVSGPAIYMYAQVTLPVHYFCGDGETSTIPGFSNYTPPVCWWAPQFTPTGLEAYYNANYGVSSVSGTAQQLHAEYDPNGDLAPPSTYKTTQPPPWQDWNKVGSPPGMWWGMTFNDDASVLVQQQAAFNNCLATLTSRGAEEWYWVPNGTTSPQPHGGVATVNGQQLADYVASKVKVETPTFTTNPPPGTKDTVHVGEWVWSSNNLAPGAGTIGNYPTQIDVTGICVQNTNVCVEVRAHATSLAITTDDPSAVVDAAGCAANAAGDMGTPYAAADGNSSPTCGVTFSSPGNHVINVSAVWTVKITWNGGNLVAQAQSTPAVDAVNVQEVQAVNN